MRGRTSRRSVRLILVAALLACGVIVAGTFASTASTLTLLDRYLAGSFDEVVRGFDDTTNYDRLYKDLVRDGAAWIAAGGEAERARRELAAATFALEAARADEWYEWKWIQSQPSGSPAVWWKAPPLFIEWGCEIMRKSDPARPIERIWQLAALAVAQRSEDGQFLIGDTEVDPGDRAAALAAAAKANAAAPVPAPAAPIPAGPVKGQPPLVHGQRRHPEEVVNVQKEIKHLMHVTERFPAERRFMLGQGIARERFTPEDALSIYISLADDPWVGAEARMRMGGILLRRGRVPDAMIQFDRVERMTRDSYVLYLTRLFRGQAFLRLKQEDNAMTALRGAVAVRPGMQSASVLLAELLIKNDLRAEAQRLMAQVLASAGSYEPYLEYMHADDRFWLQLIERLRGEIRQ